MLSLYSPSPSTNYYVQWNSGWRPPRQQDHPVIRTTSVRSLVIYYGNALHSVSITRPPRFPDQDHYILVQNYKFNSAKATICAQ